MVKTFSPFKNANAALTAFAMVYFCLAFEAHAQPTYTRALDLIAAAPANSWVKLNANTISAVWTPLALNPDPDFGPSTVIDAWGGLAWDGLRGKLVAHGGGHANYKGNEVYTWDVTTGNWQRASLPSALVPLSTFGTTGELANELMPIDGAAPNSCHQYANPAYLPVVDRVVYFCGAGHIMARTNIFARANGSVYYPGPFFWNPALADANKVGGTQGSHVRREEPYTAATAIAAGNMWQARKQWESLPVGTGFAFLESTSAYRREGGQDVVYVTASGDNGSTAMRLYKYAIDPTNNPLLDTWQFVGEYWNGYAGSPGGAFVHPTLNVLVKPGGDAQEFMYWKLDTASISDPENNRDILITPTLASGTTFTGASSSALSWDSKRSHAVVWKGGTGIWKLQSPASLSATGWVLSALPVVNPTLGPAESINPVQNRMRYLAELDAYVAVAEGINGDVWAYKPADWSRPGTNAPPTISITSPAPNAEHVTTDTISVQVNAADVDGTVVRVEVMLNGTLVGSSTTAPFTIQLTNAPIGYHNLSAIAIDNTDAQSASATQKLVVLPAQGTVLRHRTAPAIVTSSLAAHLLCADTSGERTAAFTFPSGADTVVSVFADIAPSTQCFASARLLSEPNSVFAFPAPTRLINQPVGLLDLTLTTTARQATSVMKAVTTATGTIVPMTCEYYAPGLAWRKIFNVATVSGMVTASPVPEGAHCSVPSSASGILM